MELTWGVFIVLVLRIALVALFVPFSVYYMLKDFRGAWTHAASAGFSRRTAQLMILGAVALKLTASLGLISGIADRLSSLALAGFCLATALLYKQFWRGGVQFDSASANLPKLWDFLKNIALAAAFLLIGFGTNAAQVERNAAAFMRDPLASSQPYS